MPSLRSLIPIISVLPLMLTGCGHLGIFEPAREVQCFEAARISLKDAIAAAETGGGRVLDADYRQDEELGCIRNDPGAYDITLLTNGRISVVSVNARTGEVGPRQEAGVMNALLGAGRFEGSPADMVRVVPNMSMSVSRAIDIAEEQGGKAMVAWVEAKNGQPGYTIKLVEHGRVHVTWVNGGKGAPG